MSLASKTTQFCSDVCQARSVCSVIKEQACTVVAVMPVPYLCMSNVTNIPCTVSVPSQALFSACMQGMDIAEAEGALCHNRC